MSGACSFGQGGGGHLIFESFVPAPLHETQTPFVSICSGHPRLQLLQSRKDLIFCLCESRCLLLRHRYLPHGQADRVGVALNDVYAVSRERLLRYSKETYAGLLAQVVACGDAAAEVDHCNATNPRPATKDDYEALINEAMI